MTQSRYDHISRIVVEVDAVRVGVAGGVEPVAAAVLAPVRRRQQPVDVAARRRRATCR